MKQSYFEIKLTSTDQFYFTYKLQNEQTTIISKSFSSRSEIERCISLIRDTSKVAAIKNEDDCEGTSNNKEPYPYFLVRTIKEGTRFSLIGFSGEIIFTSNSFDLYSDCISAISDLKNNVVEAGIIDLIL